MFKTKEYLMVFEKEGKDTLRVSIVNHQLDVHSSKDNYRNSYNYRVIQGCSDEHECVSMIAYYSSMGYVLTKFHIKRMMILSWDEIKEKERGIDIWEKWKQQKKS